MRNAILALAGFAALSACEPVEAPAPEDTCGAAGYQGLIGQPQSILDGMSFPIGTRRIGPDDAVTADYRAERLNIEYGHNGRIDRVSCY